MQRQIPYALLVLAFVLCPITRMGADCAPPEYTIKPFFAFCVGPCAYNHQGCFSINGDPYREYFLGSYKDRSTKHDQEVSVFEMDFDTPFTDGPGPDFAIRTGPQPSAAAKVQLQFYLDDAPVATLNVTLLADQLNEFDLGLSGQRHVAANRVVLTDKESVTDPKSPKPLGISLEDAGAAYPAQ
jgi:hypothetical protein